MKTTESARSIQSMQPLETDVLTDKKQRGWMFMTSFVVYVILMSICFIIIPVTLASSVFFTVFDRSHYIEIADIFNKIDLYLQGHCINYVDGSKSCHLLSFPEMFFRFPDFNSFPKIVSPADIPTLFTLIPGQNNFVFLPLLAAEIGAVVSIGFAVRAYKRMTRRSIAACFVPLSVTLVLCSVSLGIANKIYGDIIPSLLNKPMTVEISQNGNIINLTGRPTDVGISFETGAGMGMLGGLVAMCVIVVLVNVRWVFEGRKEVSTDRIANRSIW